ncbi:hypothetical protein D3C75_736110 [compost metagenome]
MQGVPLGLSAKLGCGLLQLVLRLLLVLELLRNPSFVNCSAQIGQNCVLGHRWERTPGRFWRYHQKIFR